MPDVPNGTRTNLELRAKHVENSKVGYANVSALQKKKPCYLCP